MASSRTIRVLLADEHEMVATSLYMAFEGIMDIDLIGRAANGAQAVQMVEKLQPDVVLMDLSMPVMDGFRATAIIRERFTQVKVVVLSASTLQSDIEAAMQAGAHSYLTKENSTESIIAAIRAAVR